MRRNSYGAPNRVWEYTSTCWLRWWKLCHYYVGTARLTKVPDVMSARWRQSITQPRRQWLPSKKSKRP